MPDDSDRASRPWTMTFRVTGEPRCPGCCVKLAAIVITFQEGWAWCPVCIGEALHAQVHLRYVLHHDIMTRCSVISHGLRFYLPHPSNGELPNAIDQFERLINEPEPEPAAVAAWPGFTLAQLPDAVRERRSKLDVRFCHAVNVPFGYEVAGIAEDDRLILLEIKESEPA